jgi:hypothetical protein
VKKVTTFHLLGQQPLGSSRARKGDEPVMRIMKSIRGNDS